MIKEQVKFRNIAVIGEYIVNYLSNYPIEGYGTKFNIEVDINNRDKEIIYILNIMRYESCD